MCIMPVEFIFASLYIDLLIFVGFIFENILPQVIFSWKTSFLCSAAITRTRPKTVLATAEVLLMNYSCNSIAMLIP